MPSAKGRLVRQDGSASEVTVSEYSLKGCHLPQELPIGELVSVEFPDVAVLVGRVHASRSGTSQIMFTGIVG